MDYSRIVTLPGGTKLGLTYDPITNKTLVPDSEIQMLRGTGEVDFRDVITGDDLKRLFGDNVTFVSDEYYSNFLKNLNIPSQMSGLYQTTNPNILGYSQPSAGITALPEAQEQAQVVQDTDTSFGNIQTHFDQNQMLKEAVSRGDITAEQYNELGGYDVTQTIAGGNPLLGGVANLIGSVPYNIYQSIKGNQPFSDIPGDVYRNIKGGLGIISPELKNKYNQFIQQTQQISPTVAQNISETVSNYNPFQQQRYMQYAAQNPEKAQAAAQQAQEFAMARKR